MVPLDDTETAVDGQAALLNVAEKPVLYDWGIEPVDLDIEIPMHRPSFNASLFDGSPDDVALDAGHGLFSNSINLDPIQVLPDETLSVFDRYPEAFTDDRDRSADNTHYTPNGMPSDTTSIYGQLANTPSVNPDNLPYSYMVEHPGYTPKALSILKQHPVAEAWAEKIRRPKYVDPMQIDHYHAFNIAGERALEHRFKQISNPVNYLLVVRGFKCIMAIRNMSIDNKAMVDGRLIGLLIGRLFCGNVTTLKIFNKHFLPKNLVVVPSVGQDEVLEHFKALRARYRRDRAARVPEMARLLRMLKYFVEEARRAEGEPEPVGRLMMVQPDTGVEGVQVEVPRGGKEVPPGSELPRAFALSPQFMAHLGPKWPFWMSPRGVDVCRMLDQTPVRVVGLPVTVCPRQTQLRGVERRPRV